MATIVGLIGRSGSGKTTLGIELVKRFRAAGYRVAVVKDAHHGFDMDRPGKDSWRYREAGAQSVVVRTDARWVMLTETPEREVTLAELTAKLDPELDLVVVEGFKHEKGFPKWEVWRKAAETEGPLFKLAPSADLAGVISDCDAEALGTTLEVLSVDDVDAIEARWHELYLTH